MVPRYFSPDILWRFYLDDCGIFFFFISLVVSEYVWVVRVQRNGNKSRALSSTVLDYSLTTKEFLSTLEKL